jgi:hypothetical protein
MAAQDAVFFIQFRKPVDQLVIGFRMKIIPHGYIMGDIMNGFLQKSYFLESG